MTAPPTYDLNAVADALAVVFQGIETGDELDGVATVVTAYSEVADDVSVPAVVLELDSLDWDISMGGGGADTFTFVATVLVQFAEAKTAQRALRAFLSRAPTAGVARLKAALEADKTLGGLVSFAHMASARRIGLIKYGDVDYLGAELPIEVMS